MRLRVGDIMQSVLITPEGIQKNLKSVKPLDAICEYIWNGFDAGASEVRVDLHENDFGIINMVSVADNGAGISYEELKWKFQPFNDSKKATGDNWMNHTLQHGKKGIGRLTFFAFAQNARWETVYSKNNKNYCYYIEMHKESLNQFDDNGGEKPKETNYPTGTKVIFTQIEVLDKEEIIEKIKENFFWFLELNEKRQFHIYINDEDISVRDLIIHKQLIDVSGKKVKNEYEVKFVQWKIRLGNEYSKIYYIGSDDREHYKETTKLNKQSDEFYHSVFIKSSYFDDFHFEKNVSEGQGDLFSSKNDIEYKALMDSVNHFLSDYRRNYLKKASDDYIAKSHITMTIKLLCDRQKVIQALKELVFTKEFNAYEVPHIQKLVEENYWIFGEKYHLISAAEPDFKLALEGLLAAQTGSREKVDLLHPDKNKEMDIFMIRQDRSGKVTQNVVVELKRPKVKLGEDEVSQVKKYLRVIKSERRFNAGEVQWTFYLVGSEFNQSHYIEGEIENSANHGEKHLIYWRDNGLTKIYALKWSEIFDDYARRHEFLMKRLRLEEKIWLEKHGSAEEAVQSIEGNSAKAEKALIPKNAKQS